VWSQRAFGWQNHLHQILDELSSESRVNPFFADSRGYEYIYWSGQARLRLLICELALASLARRTGPQVSAACTDRPTKPKRRCTSIPPDQRRIHPLQPRQQLRRRQRRSARGR
jgi:hypothetical protein